MRTQQFSCACLLSSVICFGQYALAQAQSKEDATRCDKAVVKRLWLHFDPTGFAYPASGKYPSVENGGLLVAGICKPWPANKSRTIAAFAYDAGIEYEKQLLLAVIDRPSNRVIASYKGVITEDAGTEVSSYSLRLDTARYTLSKNARAFGLRLSTFRDRCTYEGGSDDELTLFVVDGQTIRPVLTETMSHWSYGGGNRCGGEDAPSTDANTLINIEPTISNGFADLRFTAIRSDKKKPISVVVRYSGERYDLKQWSEAFDAWWY
ncbi:MAG: hypothetical protein IPL70_09030 [Uliginosibacterium sp.]|nr:hypothetical protein [Uliginosibacterium sp.]